MICGIIKFGWRISNNFLILLEGDILGRIISIVNQKGGVGKTTTSVNLTAAVGIKNKKTLLVDLDPQGNSTSGMGILKKEVKGSVYDVLIDHQAVDSLIINTKFKNVDILPSGIELAGAEIEMVELKERTFLLKYALSIIKEKYDYIFIDCPPSLGILTLNALTASDTILIPIQCEYYALEGLSQLVSTVRQVKKLYNPTLDIEGVLFTMYDSRLKLTMQVVNEVKKHFEKKVYKSVIPKNVRLSEAPSFGEPVAYYDKNSKGAKAYKSLAGELLKKHKNRKE